MSESKKFEMVIESLNKQISYHQEKLNKYKSALETIKEIMPEFDDDSPGSGKIVGCTEAVRMFFSENAEYRWKPIDIKEGIQTMINEGRIIMDSVREPKTFVDSTLRSLVKQKELIKYVDEDGTYYSTPLDEET